MRKTPTQDELDLIASKFLMNLPKEQLSQRRISFHFERAYFYFLDHHANLPSSSDIKQKQKELSTFFKLLISVLPQNDFPKYHSNVIYDQINENYNQIPTHGIILFNLNLTKILLVKTDLSTKFSFPKGKIGECQTPQECAYRQFKEQVGFSLSGESNMYCLKVSFYGKSLNFYAHKIEEENILSRRNKRESENIRSNKNGKVEIQQIKWIGFPGELQELVKNQKINHLSKEVFEELKKKLKNQMYKEKKKKDVCPLQQFKGFNRRVFQN